MASSTSSSPTVEITTRRVSRFRAASSRTSGDGTFADATEHVLGEHALLTRVIKLADLDGDRDLDIVLGTTYDTQSRLLRNEGGGVLGRCDRIRTSRPSI